jgi:hypothetical protein
MSGTVLEDFYGHRSPSTAPALTAGAVSTTVAGTIAPTTSSGAAPTITAVVANDNYGTFTLNPVTGGGAQAAGAQVLVSFAAPFDRPPSCVVVTVTNITVAATPVAVAAYATGITSNVFNVTTPALTTANNYLVQYIVLR